MRLKPRIYIFLTLIIVGISVNCQENLTFLTDYQDITEIEEKGCFAIESFDEDEYSKLNTLKKSNSVSTSDYDMYILSVQWGSMILIFLT